MFILGCIPVFLSIHEVAQISSNNTELNFFNILTLSALFLQGAIIIYVSIYFNRVVENANLFVTKLHEAEVKYIKLKDPKKVKRPSYDLTPKS